MIIATTYDLWQTVYLVTDPEQLPRMVTNIEYNGQTKYELSYGTHVSFHYEPEITAEPNLVTKTQ